MSMITYRIPQSSGKYLCGADPSPAEALLGNFSGALLGISRSDIENGDILPFQKLFAQRTKRTFLRSHCESVHFSIDGFSGIVPEIYEILSVRSYISKLHQRFPDWVYFGSLESPNLIAFILCLVSESAFRIKYRRQQLIVEVSAKDILKICRETLPKITLLYEASRIGRKERRSHQESLTSYLGIGGTQ